MLAERYGYTPDQIANMTWKQQIMLLDEEAGPTKTFSTYAEYQRWKAENL